MRAETNKKTNSHKNKDTNRQTVTKTQTELEKRGGIRTRNVITFNIVRRHDKRKNVKEK